MNELLKTQANTVAAVEVKLLEKFMSKTVAELIEPSIEIVRDLKASLSFCVISSNPTAIIQSPCKTLFVAEVETDENKFITGFNMTCNPKKAKKFSYKWAEQNADHFKNGQGDFTHIAESVASEATLKRTIENASFMVNSIIKSKTAKLSSWADIQGDYMGEFYKHDNSSLTE